MSNLRAICHPPRIVLSSFICSTTSRDQARLGFSFHNPTYRSYRAFSPSLSSCPWLSFSYFLRSDPLHRVNLRRTLLEHGQRRSLLMKLSLLDAVFHACVQKTIPKSSFVELERDADDEKIKFSYRRLAKFYHPDVYNGRGTLEEGETAEARFIKIQAAYELLIDEKKRRDYDSEHRVNPMKASQAWMEWLIKKRKAFDQRGDMAISIWAEQQQRELNIRARLLSRSKIDPDEEKRILAREKKASMEYFSSTLRRHTLVLKKRDLTRKKKAEEEKRKTISQLLAAEGLELDTDDDESV